MNKGTFIPSFVSINEIKSKYPDYNEFPDFGKRLVTLIVYFKMRNSTELAEKIFENRAHSIEYSYYFSMPKGDVDYKKIVDGLRKLIDKHIKTEVNVGKTQIKEYCEVFLCSADYFFGYIDYPTQSDTDICNQLGLSLRVKKYLEELNKQLIYENHSHYIEMINFLFSHEETLIMLEHMYNYFFGNYTRTKNNETIIDIFDEEKKYGTGLIIEEIDTVFLGMITNLLSVIKERIVRNNKDYKYYGRSLTYITLKDLENILEYIKKQKDINANKPLMKTYNNLQLTIENDIEHKIRMNIQAKPYDISNIPEYIRQRLLDGVVSISNMGITKGSD